MTLKELLEKYDGFEQDEFIHLVVPCSNKVQVVSTGAWPLWDGLGNREVAWFSIEETEGKLMVGLKED